ncbi:MULTISPECIES: DUF488 domain-containing protein [Thermomonas]|uniref:DUF488 domain-containing protein n=1 Tax=Thermomonas TaxID=141948 RepID=UPI000428DC1D|nr:MULTISPECIES: DUF488 family protein [Thermomonas]
MSVRIVRLGTPRLPAEGLRIGTVRRPPRGVPKSEFAKRDFYDVWLPTVAPSQAAMDIAHAAVTAKDWANFFRHYRSEMKRPDAAHAIALLAALSQGTDFSVGCYCEDEAHCHRHELRRLLQEAGAKVVA